MYCARVELPSNEAAHGCRIPPMPDRLERAAGATDAFMKIAPRGRASVRYLVGRDRAACLTAAMI